MTDRPLHIIADDIRCNWNNLSAYAAPYVDAMTDLSKLNDMYHSDSATSIVRYFLSNAGSWRGEHAKRIKAELNAMLKAHN